MDKLTDRLPPAIVGSPRQKELFEAIDNYWEQNVIPSIQRLRDLRSVFTATDEDLSMMLEELTAYFDYASDDLTKPLSIFWKKNEINNKNNEWALDALLQRIKFTASDIEFIPLYCPKDTATHPYGTVFHTMQGILDMEAEPSDFFLSSHMSINIDREAMLKSNWEEDNLRYAVERYFDENVRPTHIVFSGVNYFFYCQTTSYIRMATQANRIIVCASIN